MVTHGPVVPQVRPGLGSKPTDSQADSAGSIPVTRSSCHLASWSPRPSVRFAAEVLGLVLLNVSMETIFPAQSHDSDGVTLFCSA
jgi:hypothetical protein